VILDPNRPDDRAVLEAARSWGVPPSVFLGEDGPVTHYQNNMAGELVSSYTESPWRDDDQASAVALIQYEASLCAGCRTPLDETTAAEAEESYVPSVIRCHRCTTIQQYQDTLQDRPTPGALLVSTVRRSDLPTEKT
jgi:hypothetical protein